MHSQKQMTLEGFETPFGWEMDKNNRRLAETGRMYSLGHPTRGLLPKLYDENGASGQRLPFSHWRRDHQA